MRQSIFILIAISFLACKEQYPFPYTITKSATSRDGMVSTAHPIATQVGVDILKQGGNAADAVIAVEFALAVVYPRAGNIGGGGFLVYRDSTGAITSLDFRETAPLAATRDMFLDSLGNVIPGLSENGLLSVGVPSTVAGLYEAHSKHGQLPWATLIAPAIHLAKKGFRITELEAKRLNDHKELFSTYNAFEFPFVKDEAWKPGDVLNQLQLARTLEAIANDGSDWYYKGPHADSLAAFCKRQGGLISKQDMQSYATKWREPHINHFRGYDLYSMGLPSSGGIVLGNILDYVDQHLVDTIDYHDPRNVHLIVEAERRAYQMRAMLLGDIDHYPINLDSLSEAKPIRNAFADFDPAKATPSSALHPDTMRLKQDRFETTHISIVDRHGNAASLTTTLNGNYGSKVWFPYGGYFLNNTMDDFSAKPGVPNYFGLIGGEANAIAPGKRMLSSMTPTIIEKDNELYMVLGTPGGSTIITSVLQVFLNKTVFNMSIEDAVQSPRYHHQWLPDQIMHENATFDSTQIQTLRQLGHQFLIKDPIGMVEAIYVDENGLLHGVADKRAEAHASGL